MRSPTASATRIAPPGLTATPVGALNCPLPAPALPKGNSKAAPCAHAGLAPSARLASRKMPHSACPPRVIVLPPHSLVRRSAALFSSRQLPPCKRLERPHLP